MWRVVGLGSCGMLLSCLALAQTSPRPTSQGEAVPQTALPNAAEAPMAVLPPVEVIAPTPLLGSGVDRNKVPGQNQVLTGKDVTLEGSPSLSRALQTQAQGVDLLNASGNPQQPDVFYHGFEASALQGTPQGLAVYVNGARFNDPFGDTVNWDLIPNIAIDRINLVVSTGQDRW